MRQYEQPIEDWMNQMDYDGMAKDCREMVNRYHWVKREIDTTISSLIDGWNFETDLLDFEFYCKRQATKMER